MDDNDARSPSTPPPPSAVRGFTRSPPRFPTRLRPRDDLLSDLSPAKSLRAISSPHGALKNSMETASPSERAFGIEAIVASEKIQTWTSELADWPWSGDMFTGFETHPAKRRRLSDDVQRNEQVDLGSTRPQNALEDLDSQDYRGSLSSTEIPKYESRIDDIAAEMEDLDVEGIKARILENSLLSRSRPNSAASVERPIFMAEEVAKFDDFAAMVTAVVLQTLPHLSRLTRLMDIWSVRLAVLKEVPSFLMSLEDAEVALNSGWRTMELPIEADVGESNAISSKEESSPIGATVSPQDYDVMQRVLQEKVTKAGRRVDRLLDALEGRDDCLPDSWLDRMDAVEQNYGEWVAIGQQKVREAEFTAHMRTLESQRVRAMEISPHEAESALVMPNLDALKDERQAQPELGVQNTALDDFAQSSKSSTVLLNPSFQDAILDSKDAEPSGTASVIPLEDRAGKEEKVKHEDKREIHEEQRQDEEREEREEDAKKNEADRREAEEGEPGNEKSGKEEPGKRVVLMEVMKLEQEHEEEREENHSHDHEQKHVQEKQYLYVQEQQQQQQQQQQHGLEHEDVHVQDQDQVQGQKHEDVHVQYQDQDRKHEHEYGHEQEHVHEHEQEQEHVRKQNQDQDEEYENEPEEEGRWRGHGHEHKYLHEQEQDDDSEEDNDKEEDREKEIGKEFKKESNQTAQPDEIGVESRNSATTFNQRSEIMNSDEVEKPLPPISLYSPFDGQRDVYVPEIKEYASGDIAPVDSSQEMETLSEASESSTQNSAGISEVKTPHVAIAPTSNDNENSEQNTFSHLESSDPALSSNLPTKPSDEAVNPFHEAVDAIEALSASLLPETSEQVDAIETVLPTSRSIDNGVPTQTTLPETAIERHNAVVIAATDTASQPTTNFPISSEESSQPVHSEPDNEQKSAEPTDAHEALTSPYPDNKTNRSSKQHEKSTLSRVLNAEMSPSKGHSRAVSNISSISEYPSSEPSPEICAAEPREYFRPTLSSIRNDSERSGSLRAITPTQEGGVSQLTIPLNTATLESNSSKSVSRETTPTRKNIRLLPDTNETSDYGSRTFVPRGERERNDYDRPSVTHQLNGTPTDISSPGIVAIKDVELEGKGLNQDGSISVQSPFQSTIVEANFEDTDAPRTPIMIGRSPSSDYSPEEPSPSLRKIYNPRPSERVVANSSLPIISTPEEPFAIHLDGSQLSLADTDIPPSLPSLMPSPSISRSESPELSDLETPSSPVSKPSVNSAMDDQFRQQITEILESLPARIHLSSEPDRSSSSGTAMKPKLRKKHSSNPPGNSRPATRAPTPSFTLAPASSKVPRPRHQNGNPEIKVYHLSRSTDEAPIKLFVRLVGEHGERVMVRVGGGWADLGEYLKEYATHHGRRSGATDDGRVEVSDFGSRSFSSSSRLSTSTSTSTSTVRNVSNNKPSSSNSFDRSSPVAGGSDTPPPYHRSGGASGGASNSRPGSSLAVRKTRRPAGQADERRTAAPSTPLSGTGLAGVGVSGNSSSSRHLQQHQHQHHETPPSAVSSVASRPSSKMSWTEEDSSLGLAGPKGKKTEISEEKLKWVESMKEKVRLASAEKERRVSISGSGGGGNSGSGNSGSSKADFGELGTVGGTKRLFRKG